MRVAILALQGAFIEHEKMLARLGVETFEVRQLRDWEQPKDGLIIPGGESTVQIKLLRDLGLYAPVAEAIKIARLWNLCRTYHACQDTGWRACQPSLDNGH